MVFRLPFLNRFVRRSNADEILIYTDGACLNNGQPNPTAGCAFVFHPPQALPSKPQQAVVGTIAFRLENHGPTGTPQPQTSNRAELRAVIAALQFRVWVGEGWKRLVIATDSEYVVNGATKWARDWERKGWVTAKKEPVKNRDLWELLLREVRKHAEMGLAVLFWRIPRELNRDADEAAKKAAASDEVGEFVKSAGMMFNGIDMAVMQGPLQNFG
jgi:ribonuclease HI